MTEQGTPDGLSLSKHTTPTWEMELLISGVTVFALLQLPGILDQAYLALLPKLDLDLEAIAQLLFMYSKMGVLVLAAAFVIHLTMRGYWIALVGMHSIYPEGVLWDRLKIGPLQRRQIEQDGASDEERIELADNRASIVFALGITLTLTMVSLILVVSLAFLLSGLLSWSFGWQWIFPNGAFLLVVMSFVPLVLALTLDRRYGTRLAPDGRTAGAIKTVFAVASRFGFGRGGNPTMSLLQSHFGTRKVVFATASAIMLLAFFVMGQLALQQRNMSVGDYALWPDATFGATDSVVNVHYRDQPDQGNALVPTIDSLFPNGGYLSLIVPFDPRRHPALLAKACPKIWSAVAGPKRRADLLACMGQLQDLQLDGHAVLPLQLHYYSDPKSTQNSVLIIVPISGLARGEHSLSLKQALATDRPALSAEQERYRIEFWR